MDNAFLYIKKNKGIDTESSYPYEAQDDTCRYKKIDSGADDTGYVDIPSGDEDKLMKAVASVGPVSILLKTLVEMGICGCFDLICGLIYVLGLHCH